MSLLEALKYANTEGKWPEISEEEKKNAHHGCDQLSSRLPHP